MAYSSPLVAFLYVIIALMIVYDALNHREWLDGVERVILVALGLVPFLGPVLYMGAVYSRESRLEECPECGGRVEVSAETCPHCGHNPYESHDAVERVYECEDCDAEFSEWVGLEEHVRKNHLEEQDGEGDDDQHSCDECGRTFDSERGLHVHQSVIHE
jgi:ribosomal protein L37AE/L43A